MKRREIALIKESRRSLLIPSLLDLIKDHLTLKKNAHIGIKVNLSGSKEIYANTNYESVAILVKYLKKNFNPAKISIIEGSDGAFFSQRSTWDIFYKFKYKELEFEGAELVNLDELDHNQTLLVETISGEKEVSYLKYPCDYLISITPPKTHNILPAFLSIPNLIGFVKAGQRAMVFGASAEEMKKINFSSNEKYFYLNLYANRNFLRLFNSINPQLAIIDGLFGMEGRGPIKGSPVFHGFGVACEDFVLADALTIFLMGFNCNDLEYLELAYQNSLGLNRWQNILGSDYQSVKFPYRPHPLFYRQKQAQAFASRLKPFKLELER